MTEKLQDIAVNLIDPSPENPRKYFDPAYITELAKSVESLGVQQPIALRPKGKRYTVIYGECRWRASKEAGKATVPSIVRDVDDDEADVLRHVENDQRKDLRPIERALGYLALMAKHKLTVEQVASRVGKSPATVRDVMALNKLIAPAKAALLDPKLKGEFTASHALWVAHVPAKLQPEVLQAALTGNDDGGVLGVRALKTLVKRDYMLSLSKARFDPTDATLVPKAGACGPCQYRSGNQPGEVSADVGDPNTCENKPCFREKEGAWLELQKKAGRTVLSAAEAKEAFGGYGGDHLAYNAGYVDANEKPHGSKTTYAKKVAPDQVVLARSPSGRVVELVARAVLPKEKDPFGRDDSAPREKSANQVKAERDREVSQAIAGAALTELMLCSSTLTADNRFFRTLCFAATKVVHSDGLKRVAKRRGLEDAEGLMVLAMKLVGAELQGLALEMLLSQSLSGGGFYTSKDQAEELEQGCHLMGVDLTKVEKEQRELLTKAWAEKAAKKKAAAKRKEAA